MSELKRRFETHIAALESHYRFQNAVMKKNLKTHMISEFNALSCLLYIRNIKKKPTRLQVNAFTFTDQFKISS